VPIIVLIVALTARLGLDIGARSAQISSQ